MTDTARARKLADRVREVVAEALEKRIKDPRLGFITVTDTRMTGDLQHATVFYTVFGDDEERTATAAALESAKGVLRAEVGKRIGIRLTPTLEFIADALPESADRMNDLISLAQERDAAVAALANGATYAGDPDPYKKPVDELHDEVDAAFDDDDDENDDDENDADENDDGEKLDTGTTASVDVSDQKPIR